MQTVQSSAAHNLPIFPPLEQVTRPTVPTDAAAYYLNRQPQTLRAWACLENGALRPVRISGRLAWSVAAIRALLNGEAA
ncbi:MAG: DNA-binding protein [Gallionella sp.]|nr:DNA-binding protein [Gallionella sp.]